MDSVCNYLDGFKRSRLKEQPIKTAFLVTIIISYNYILFHCYRVSRIKKCFFRKKAVAIIVVHNRVY